MSNREPRYWHDGVRPIDFKDIKSYEEQREREWRVEKMMERAKEDAAARKRIAEQEAYPGELEDIARSEAERAKSVRVDNSKEEK